LTSFSRFDNIQVAYQVLVEFDHKERGGELNFEFAISFVLHVIDIPARKLAGLKFALLHVHWDLIQWTLPCAALACAKDLQLVDQVAGKHVSFELGLFHTRPADRAIRGLRAVLEPPVDALPAEDMAIVYSQNGDLHSWFWLGRWRLHDRL